MAVSTGSIPRFLQEGLNATFGNSYDAHPIQYDKIFATLKSTKNFEVDAQMEALSAASVKDEGQDILFQDFRQGITPKYPSVTVATGFSVTMEALQDELYNELDKKAGSLAFAMTQAKEIRGANVLNNAFDSNFTMIDGDGLELCSLLHIRGPDGVTFANELSVATALSEAALEDMSILIGDAVDSKGNKIALQEKTLIVATANKFNAHRILNSVLRVDTADNDTNALRDMNVIGSVAVNNYLTDSGAWFVTTNAPQGMQYFTRMAVEFGTDNAFSSKNNLEAAVERYSFGWTDAHGIYGSDGP